MDDPFDSAWFKWGRAVVHAQALDGELRRELEKFKTQRPWTTRTEYDAKHHCVRLLVDRAKPFHPRLGLLIGDTANNFRASLDHLAWALVTTRGKRPMLPKEESRIYFPLALTQEAFDSHFVVTNFLTRADRATLRRYQPYVHGKRQALNHCLPPLPGLNRDDKHRMLRPIAARPQGGGLRVGESTSPPGTSSRCSWSSRSHRPTRSENSGSSRLPGRQVTSRPRASKALPPATG
jgi:hypothetical protein